MRHGPAGRWQILWALPTPFRITSPIRAWAVGTISTWPVTSCIGEVWAWFWISSRTIRASIIPGSARIRNITFRETLKTSAKTPPHSFWLSAKIPCSSLRAEKTPTSLHGLNDVFARTWGSLLTGFKAPPEEFWPSAVAALPDFIWIGEVYWDLEWRLQQLGLTFTYDKRLYDRLLNSPPEEVRLHL